MILVIPEVFSAEECHAIRERLAQASWQDGRATAGYIAVQQKSNEQLNVQDPVAIELAQAVLQRLSSLPKFVSFALPLKILPPMFNRYQGGGAYGFHIDNAIRVHPQTGERIRTDISTTVFLSDPDSYEGGELEIQDNYGTQRVKLPAGHAVVYPGTSLHRVCPVTQGERLAAFFGHKAWCAKTARVIPYTNWITWCSNWRAVVIRWMRSHAYLVCITTLYANGGKHEPSRGITARAKLFGRLRTTCQRATAGGDVGVCERGGGGWHHPTS